MWLCCAVLGWAGLSWIGHLLLPGRAACAAVAAKGCVAAHEQVGLTWVDTAARGTRKCDAMPGWLAVRFGSVWSRPAGSAPLSWIALIGAAWEAAAV